MNTSNFIVKVAIPWPAKPPKSSVHNHFDCCGYSQLYSNAENYMECTQRCSVLTQVNQRRGCVAEHPFREYDPRKSNAIMMNEKVCGHHALHAFNRNETETGQIRFQIQAPISNLNTFLHICIDAICLVCINRS